MKYSVKLSLVILYSFFLLVNKVEAENSVVLIDSLKAELQHAVSDTNKVWILRDIAYYYLYIDMDSSIHYSTRGYNLARNLDHSYGAIWNLYQTGLAYEIGNQLDKSLSVYHQAIELAESVNDIVSIAKLYNAIGVAYYYSGEFTEAVRNYLMGYNYADSSNYTEGKAYALNNLGVIYRKQRRYQKALDVYLKSLAIKTSERDSQGMVVTLYNIGLIHAYLGKYEKSIEQFNEAKRLSGEVSDLMWDKSHLDIAMGVALYHLDDLNQSQKYLKTALEKIDTTSITEYIYGLGYLGSILVKTDQPTLGMAMLKKARDKSFQTNNKELQREILRELAQASEYTQQYELSAESWKEYTILSDSLYEESQFWAMEEMQSKFELQEKEITIARQRFALEREMSRKRLYFITGLFLIVLLIISGIFLRLFWKQKEALQKQYKLTQSALKDNELLMREMHHRTKNNLQLLNSLLSLQWRKVNSADGKKALQSSRDSVGAISLLHRRLYKSNDIQNVPLDLYISDLAGHFEEAFALSSRKIDICYSCPKMHIDTDKAIHIGLIVNEMVTNAVLHAFDEGQSGIIEINVYQSDNMLRLEVNDNGKGMKNMSLHKEGIGRQLIRILGERYGGKFEMTNQYQGTKATFTMPIHIASEVT